MDLAHQQVLNLYSERLRLRVCGICLQDDKLLMINHAGVVQGQPFWCPPGGGLTFGESTTEALQREFWEETHTEIEVGNLMFVNEFLEPPLHAIELFFEVTIIGGQVEKGEDPEMKNQIIQEIAWMSFDEINALPPAQVHRVVGLCKSIEQLKNVSGYLAKNIPFE